MYESKQSARKFSSTSRGLIRRAVDIAIDTVAITGVAAGVLLASAPWLFY